MGEIEAIKNGYWSNTFVEIAKVHKSVISQYGINDIVEWIKIRIGVDIGLMSDIQRYLGAEWQQLKKIENYVFEVISLVQETGVKDLWSVSNVNSEGYHIIRFNMKYFGIIRRGVIDLWNYGAGEAKLSEFFKMRIAQLALSGVTYNE